MRKGRLIRAAALLLTLLFAAAAVAGCSTSKDPVVLKVGTVKMYLSDFIATYNTYYSYYSAFGIYDVSTTEKLYAFQDTIMAVLENKAVCLYQAGVDGVTLTDEEEAECAAAAEASMQKYISGYTDEVDESITDEAAIAEAARALFVAALKKNGYTYNEYYEMLLEEERNSAIINKQQQNVYDTVEVTDDDVEAYYTETLAADKAAYGEDPAQFLTDWNSYSKGSRIRPLFVPDGYKRVTHILVSTEALAAEVQEKLAAGSAWADLVEEYSTDTGMPDGGYYVSAGTVSTYYEGFGDAALALTEVGQVSEPVTTTGGIHLIRLEEIVQSAEIELDDELSGAIYDFVLAKEQESAYSAAVAEWTANAPIKRYESRYRYVGMASN